MYFPTCSDGLCSFPELLRCSFFLVVVTALCPGIDPGLAEPLMIQEAFAVGPDVRILDESFLDKVLGLRTDVHPFWSIKAKMMVINRLLNIDTRITCRERKVAAQ